MEYDEIMGARLSVLETRLSGLEQRLAVMERGSKVISQRRRRELTPEERQAVRERLVAGQAAARARREAEAKQIAKNEKKEVANGASKTAK